MNKKIHLKINLSNFNYPKSIMDIQMLVNSLNTIICPKYIPSSPGSFSNAFNTPNLSIEEEIHVF